MSSQFFWFERSFTGLDSTREMRVCRGGVGRTKAAAPAAVPAVRRRNELGARPADVRPTGRRRRAKSARIGSISSVPRPVRRGARVRREITSTGRRTSGARGSSGSATRTRTVRRGGGARPRSRGRRSTSRTRVAFRAAIQNGAKPPTSGTRRSREVRRRGARPKSPTPRPNSERKQRILSANTRICAGSEVCRLTAVRERPTSARGDEARERWV